MPVFPLIATMVAFGSLLVGCGGRTEVTRPSEAAPTVAAREHGLEAISWVSVADDQRFARLLAPYSTVHRTLDSESAAVWAANGVRVVEVPIEQAESLEQELNDPIAVRALIERQWLGQAFTWTAIATGPPLRSVTNLRTDAESVVVSPGQLRLLARAWLAPGAGSDVEEADPEFIGPPRPQLPRPRRAVLRIELVPAHKPTPDRARNESVLNAGAERPDDLILERLRIELRADGRSAYVIVPEVPGVDWANVGEGAPENAAAGSDRNGGADPARTIGSAMLEGGAYRPPINGPTLSARARRVIILLPRVPERFQLTP